MTNLHIDEMVLFLINITKIGTDENKAIYSMSIVTFTFDLKNQ